jgi:hypothetical protein
LPATNLTWNRLGMNPRLHDKKPASNRPQRSVERRRVNGYVCWTGKNLIGSGISLIREVQVVVYVRIFRNLLQELRIPPGFQIGLYCTKYFFMI